MAKPAPASHFNALQVDHQKGLGVTAVELLAIFKYDELELQYTYD